MDADISVVPIEATMQTEENQPSSQIPVCENSSLVVSSDSELLQTDPQLQHADSSSGAHSLESSSTALPTAWQKDAMKVYEILIKHPYLDVNNKITTRNMDFFSSSSNCNNQLRMIPKYLNEHRFRDEEDFFRKLISIFQRNLDDQQRTKSPRDDMCFSYLIQYITWLCLEVLPVKSQSQVLTESDTPSLTEAKQMEARSQREEFLRSSVKFDTTGVRSCVHLIKRLETSSSIDFFQSQVDTQTLVDYSQFVDQPMDLGTVKNKLESNSYNSYYEFIGDCRRIFSNAIAYHRAHLHSSDFSKQCYNAAVFMQVKLETVLPHFTLVVANSEAVSAHQAKMAHDQAMQQQIRLSQSTWPSQPIASQGPYSQVPSQALSHIFQHHHQQRQQQKQQQQQRQQQSYSYPLTVSTRVSPSAPFNGQTQPDTVNRQPAATVSELLLLERLEKHARDAVTSLYHKLTEHNMHAMPSTSGENNVQTARVNYNAPSPHAQLHPQQQQQRMENHLHAPSGLQQVRQREPALPWPTNPQQPQSQQSSEAAAQVAASATASIAAAASRNLAPSTVASMPVASSKPVIPSSSSTAAIVNNSGANGVMTVRYTEQYVVDLTLDGDSDNDNDNDGHGDENQATCINEGALGHIGHEPAAAVESGNMSDVVSSVLNQSTAQPQPQSVQLEDAPNIHQGSQASTLHCSVAAAVSASVSAGVVNKLSPSRAIKSLHPSTAAPIVNVNAMSSTSAAAAAADEVVSITNNISLESVTVAAEGRAPSSAADPSSAESFTDPEERDDDAHTGLSGLDSSSKLRRTTFQMPKLETLTISLTRLGCNKLSVQLSSFKCPRYRRQLTSCLERLRNASVRPTKSDEIEIILQNLLECHQVPELCGFLEGSPLEEVGLTAGRNIGAKLVSINSFNLFDKQVRVVGDIISQSLAKCQEERRECVLKLDFLQLTIDAYDTDNYPPAPPSTPPVIVAAAVAAVGVSAAIEPSLVVAPTAPLASTVVASSVLGVGVAGNGAAGEMSEGVGDTLGVAESQQRLTPVTAGKVNVVKKIAKSAAAASSSASLSAETIGQPTKKKKQQQEEKEMKHIHTTTSSSSSSSLGIQPIKNTNKIKKEIKNVSSSSSSSSSREKPVYIDDDEEMRFTNDSSDGDAAVVHRHSADWLRRRDRLTEKLLFLKAASSTCMINVATKKDSYLARVDEVKHDPTAATTGDDGDGHGYQYKILITWMMRGSQELVDIDPDAIEIIDESMPKRKRHA